MSSDEFDLAGDIEAAWTGFRVRLADRLAELAADECLLVEMESGVDDDELSGCTPYVQFMGWGDGDLVRAEASSNNYLDGRFQLGDDEEGLLVAMGWSRPGDEDDAGSSNFYADLEVREADRLAVMTVRSLREVFGCAHPAFLEADGIEIDPDRVLASTPTATAETPDEPVVAFPANQAELCELVDQALAVHLGEEPRHDGDGDVPLLSGRSVLYVRVDADAPAVRFFTDLVVSVADSARAELEVGILNRTHSLAKFYVRDDVIVMTYRLCATPFVPMQLRVVVDRLMGDLDDVARDLALRVGGQRFFDSFLETADDDDLVEPTAHDLSPALLGLVELMYDGPVRPRVVAALFDNDRHELIAQLVRLRIGADQLDEHDLELVLDQLRAALRFVAEAQALPPIRHGVPPKPPRTQQLTLLPEVDSTLEDSLWSHGLEESS